MMTITRYNYEEHFLLYVDHELSPAQSDAVEEFVRQNPDLKAELDALRQSVFDPEKHLVFTDKASLFRQSPESTDIRPENCEEYFLLYLDNELDATTKKSVDEFLQQNPSWNESFSLLQQARLQPDEVIVFGSREVLYRREPRKKPVALAWLSAAAAVALLLIAGFLFYERAGAGRPTGAEKGMAALSGSGHGKLINENPVVKKVKTAVTSLKVVSLNKADVGNHHLPKAIIKSATGSAGHSQDTQPFGHDPNAATVSQTALREKPAPNDWQAEVGSKIRIEEKVAEPTSIGNIRWNAAPEKIIVQVDQRDTPSFAEYQAVYASLSGDASDDDDKEPPNSSSKKNRLRGLFRTVSRVVEKATTADRGDGRTVSISSFQIAFK